MDKKFFNKWFDGFNDGLEIMSTEECSKLFFKVCI